MTENRRVKIMKNDGHMTGMGSTVWVGSEGRFSPLLWAAMAMVAEEEVVQCLELAQWAGMAMVAVEELVRCLGLAKWAAIGVVAVEDVVVSL